jgi:hypothetical protein
MAASLKIAGIDVLVALRRRVIRQYNLPGTDGAPHRISAQDRDDLLAKIDDLIAKIQDIDEFSPDVRKESPF